MFPQFTIWTGTFFTTGLLLYYGAIIGGVFKEPLMAQFRKYGDEQLPSPLLRFLQVAGFWCIFLAMLVRELATPTGYIRRTFPTAVFIVLAGMAFGASFLVWQRPDLRFSLPRWYNEVLQNSSRQERRFIGYAWLRIPFKMRWRLNGDQAAFRTWADTVRITVIYGAFDPDSPWDLWN
jgi:hypothetical protein